MIEKDIISKIVEENIEGSDKFLVEIKISTNNVIEVVIDSDTMITIDDCIKLSKHIESSLDREKEDFELSVYSAGLSEPIKLPRQYKKHLGKEVEIILKAGSKLKGELSAFNEDSITLKTQRKEKPEGAKRKVLVDYSDDIKLDDIKTTKLHIKI